MKVQVANKMIAMHEIYILQCFHDFLSSPYHETANLV